jgi:hypothetical protein
LQIDVYLAFGWLIKIGNYRQGGGLATAARTQQREKLSIKYVDGEFFDCGYLTNKF